MYLNRNSITARVVYYYHISFFFSYKNMKKNVSDFFPVEMRSEGRTRKTFLFDILFHILFFAHTTSPFQSIFFFSLYSVRPVFEF